MHFKLQYVNLTVKINLMLPLNRFHFNAHKYEVYHMDIFGLQERRLSISIHRSLK